MVLDRAIELMLTKLKFKLRSLLGGHQIVLGDAVVCDELAAYVKRISVVLRMTSLVAPFMRIAHIGSIPINVLVDGSFAHVIHRLICHNISERICHLARKRMMPSSSKELSNSATTQLIKEVSKGSTHRTI